MKVQMRQDYSIGKKGRDSKGEPVKKGEREGEVAASLMSPTKSPLAGRWMSREMDEVSG